MVQVMIALAMICVMRLNMMYMLDLAMFGTVADHMMCSNVMNRTAPMHDMTCSGRSFMNDMGSDFVGCVCMASLRHQEYSGKTAEDLQQTFKTHAIPTHALLTLPDTASHSNTKKNTIRSTCYAALL